MVAYQSSDLQICDGAAWNSVTSVLSNGSCSGTPAGTFRYNTVNSWEEWCDGTQWNVMYAQPTLALDFTKGTWPIPVQFSRAVSTNSSPGTYFNVNGVLSTAPQNLLLYSQNYTIAPWSNSYLTITAGATIAPDGTMTASKLVDASGGSNPVHYVAQSITLTTGTLYCASGYVKAAERGNMRLATGGNFSPFAYADFNIAAGTYIGGNATTAGISAVGSGWFRVNLCATHTGTNGATGGILFQTYGPSSYTYAGDDTSGYLLWGAQLELGPAPTSYTYTAASSAYGPRLDYDPANCPAGVCASKGALIEQSSKNYALYSGTRLTPTGVFSPEPPVPPCPPPRRMVVRPPPPSPVPAT
jgi:hypothetical protein